MRTHTPTCAHTVVSSQTHENAFMSRVPNTGSLIFAHNNPPLFSHCCYQIHQLGLPIHYHNATNVCFYGHIWLHLLLSERFCIVSLSMFTLARTALYVSVCDFACAFSFVCFLQWACILKMDFRAKLYNDFLENNKLRFQIKAIMEMRLWSN